MYRVSWVPLAVLVAVVSVMIFLSGSFLPFFMDQVWGPLWGVEWWPAGTTHSFRSVGPWCGVSPWPALLAVPISSVLVLTGFTLVAFCLLLKWRADSLRQG